MREPIKERIKKAREEDQESGFTLIELLVVIIILGILAAVVVFSVGGIGDKGQASACKIDTRTIRTAEEANFAQHNQYDTMANLVANGLLSQPSTLHDVTLVPANAGPPATPATYNVIEKADQSGGNSSCTNPSGQPAGGTVNGTTNL